MNSAVLAAASIKGKRGAAGVDTDRQLRNLLAALRFRLDVATEFAPGQRDIIPRQRPAAARDSVAWDVLRSPVPGDIVLEVDTS